MGKSTTETVGQRIRRIRLQRKLSQRELAEPGVSYAYLSRIEAGQRAPSIKALRIIAAKLGVTATLLETGEVLTETELREAVLAEAELELALGDGLKKATHDALTEAVEAGGEVAVRARAVLGIARLAAGDATAATWYLELAAQGLDPADRPDVYAALGECYSAAGEPGRAVRLLEDALVRLEERGIESPVLRLRYAALLASARSDLGQEDGARVALADAAELADAVDDPFARARLYWRLARDAREEGRDEAALEYLRVGATALRLAQDALGTAQAHLTVAELARVLGDADASERHLDRAERLFTPESPIADRARLLVAQARRAIAHEDADAAIVRAGEALGVLGANGADDHGAEEGEAQWALAEALALKGDVEASGTAFEQAVASLADHRRFPEAARATRGWGRMLRDAGKGEEALEVLDKATVYAIRSRGTR